MEGLSINYIDSTNEDVVVTYTPSSLVSNYSYVIIKNNEYGNNYIKFNVPENMLYEGIHNLSILHSFYNKTITADYQFYYRNTDYIIIS